MTAHPVGTLVTDGDGRIATVLRHGRDAAGVYTELLYDDGTRLRWHREATEPCAIAEPRR